MWINVLVFVYQCLIVVRTNTSVFLRQGTDKIYFGKALSSRPYSTEKSLSFSQCMDTCTRSSNCQAMVYMRTHHICYLHTNGAQNIWIDKAGPVLALKTDFSVPPNEFCEGSSCVPKDCGPIQSVKDEQVFGNQVTIGSKVKYVCNYENRDVTVVICLSGGSWSELPTCPSCRTGYEYFNDQCYKINSNMLNWNQAVDACKHDNAMLVEVANDQENDFLLQRLTDEGVRVAFIGYTDEDNEDTYVHASTGREATYIRWGHEEPNGQRNENCVAYHTGRWVDISCANTFGYICMSALSFEPL